MTHSSKDFMSFHVCLVPYPNALRYCRTLLTTIKISYWFILSDVSQFQMRQNIPRVRLSPSSLKSSKLFTQTPQSVRATRVCLLCRRSPWQPPGQQPVSHSATAPREPLCQPRAQHSPALPQSPAGARGWAAPVAPQLPCSRPGREPPASLTLPPHVCPTRTAAHSCTQLHAAALPWAGCAALLSLCRAV